MMKWLTLKEKESRSLLRRQDATCRHDLLKKWTGTGVTIRHSDMLITRSNYRSI
jgi:hypothetical protein